MDARNLNDHLDRCRKMANSKNFIDLDRDDVLSLSMVAAWQSLDCPQSQQIVPLRNTIFKKDINDLRRHVWARKRSPGRCRHFHQDEDVDGEGFPDRSQDDPLDVLIARETVAPLALFQDEHGYPPAAPCVGCGTVAPGPRRRLEPQADRRLMPSVLSKSLELAAAARPVAYGSATRPGRRRRHLRFCRLSRVQVRRAAVRGRPLPKGRHGAVVVVALTTDDRVRPLVVPVE